MSIVVGRQPTYKGRHLQCFAQTVRRYVDVDLWDTIGAEESNPPSSKNLSISSPDFVRCKYEKGKFISPWPQKEKGLWALLKWQMSSKNKIVFPTLKGASSSTCIKPLPVMKSKLFVTDRPHVTWIGHATCYFQLEGLHFITDPIFSNTCSPIEFLGNRFSPHPF